MKQEPKNESGGGGEGRKLAPFFARSLTLVPRSLLRNRTETLTTQANQEKNEGIEIVVLTNNYVLPFCSINQ